MAPQKNGSSTERASEGSSATETGQDETEKNKEELLKMLKDLPSAKSYENPNFCEKIKDHTKCRLFNRLQGDSSSGWTIFEFQWCNGPERTCYQCFTPYAVRTADMYEKEHSADCGKFEISRKDRDKLFNLGVKEVVDGSWISWSD
eukprot:GHVP01040063.1.p1 GENE.GHVP01040063.1~~GHVP01040063.1.p1  ORF type:complete len:161 (+),score=25.13 GHVP01040063.1:46-483(+)